MKNKGFIVVASDDQRDQICSGEQQARLFPDRGGRSGMKAISLWQPWASLWLTPFKVHETRHWLTDYRGPLIVHAAKRLVSECGEELDELCVEAFGPQWRTELPRGAVIGRVHLVGMVSSNQFVPDADSPDRICGNWDPDRWGWARDLRSVVRFDSPIPFIGRQGFFNVPDELFEEAVA